jgi:hypothetical protein
VTEDRCEDMWRAEIRACGDGLPERKASCFDQANQRRTNCQAPVRQKQKQRDPDEDLIRELLQ